MLGAEGPQTLRTTLLLAALLLAACASAPREVKHSVEGRALPPAPEAALRAPGEPPPDPGQRAPPCEKQEPLGFCPAGKECLTDPALRCERCHCKDASQGFAF